MPDGLGMLDEQRKRRSVRNIPAPRNPPRRTPVEVLKPVPADPDTTTQKSDATTMAPAVSIAPPATSPRPAETAQPARAEEAKPAVQEPTIKMSIYLENSDDRYLEDITHAGKTSRERIAISRSAIVRLALQRLSETMTTDQIVAELRKSGEEHHGKGRKRR